MNKVISTAIRWGGPIAAALIAQTLMGASGAVADSTAWCPPIAPRATPAAVTAPAPAPTTAPARQQPAGQHAGPVRRGDLCATAGQTGVAAPGMRAVTCGRYRGLRHLTWGP